MKGITKILLILAGILSMTSCSENPTEPQSNMGTLSISLTDAPASYEAVNITFSEISAHIDNQWIAVRGEPITVNLLDWNNGNSIEIGRADVPAGHYTQIRLKIDDCEVVLNGQTQNVIVPSGAQTGLKFGPEFDVNLGSTYELMIDFDAHRSIVAEPNGFLLQPTIRVVPKAVTGSISANVSNPNNLPIAYAVVGSDTLTSTAVDTSDGSFILAYLPEGSYTVTVSDTASLSFSSGSVNVVSGSDQDLGMITLQ